MRGIAHNSMRRKNFDYGYLDDFSTKELSPNDFLHIVSDDFNWLLAYETLFRYLFERHSVAISRPCISRTARTRIERSVRPRNSNACS